MQIPALLNRFFPRIELIDAVDTVVAVQDGGRRVLARLDIDLRGAAIGQRQLGPFRSWRPIGT